MSDTTADAVAARLEQGLRAGPDAFRPTLAGLYADEVQLRHEPPLSVDGMVSGQRLAESSEKESAAVTGVIRDARYEDASVAVDGDLVEVRGSLAGALPDGTPVRLPMLMRCRVDGGRITAITHDMGPETMRAWAEVAVAGGLVAAESLRDAGAAS